MGRLSDWGVDKYFFNEIEKTKILTETETVDLVQQYQQEKNKKVLKKIIKSYLRLLIKVGIQCKKRYQPEFITIEELVFPGIIGLKKAVKNFNPSKGVSFVNYAWRPISNKMTIYILNNWSLVRVPSNVLFGYDESPETALTGKAHIKENNMDNKGVPEDVLWGSKKTYLDEEQYIEKKYVEDILQKLPERQRQVLMDYEISEMTHVEIAKNLETSRETIRTTLKQARDRFKHFYVSTV